MTPVELVMEKAAIMREEGVRVTLPPVANDPQVCDVRSSEHGFGTLPHEWRWEVWPPRQWYECRYCGGRKP